MPHVIVKLWPGKSDRIADRDVMRVLNYAEESVSVTIEGVTRCDAKPFPSPTAPTSMIFSS